MPNIKFKKPMTVLPQRFLFKSMKDVRQIAPCYGLSVCVGFDDPVPLLGLYSRFAPRPHSQRILAKDLRTFAEENREEVNEILALHLKGRDVMEYLDKLDAEQGDITLIALIAMMDKLHVCVLHEVGFWVSHDGNVLQMKSPNPDLNTCMMYLAWMKKGGSCYCDRTSTLLPRGCHPLHLCRGRHPPPKDVYRRRSW